MTASRQRLLATALSCLFILVGCSSSGPKKSGVKTSASRGGGYYKDDGPGSDIPANLLAIPDATPRIEPHAKANSRPYKVFGVTYRPHKGDKPFRQIGIASWYGKKFHGNKTANGEIYDMYAMTAAHPTLPIPSYARVTRTANNKSVIVRINDRGPFHSARIIDLSYVAAAKLDLIAPGSGEVIVEAITQQEIAQGTYAQPQKLASAQTQPSSKPVVSSTSNTKPNKSAQPLPSESLNEVPDALLALANTQQNKQKQPAVFLQFGAFSAADNAEKFAQRLNQYVSELEGRRVKVDSGPDLHRVHLGPYPNRTEAVNAAHRIHESAGVSATVAIR